VAMMPFNFMEPFRNRDVLIIYNGMLFAVMGLLIGATPAHAGDLSGRQQTLLRVGILTVAALAVVASLHALSATVYRTFADQPTLLAGVTINRVTIIGWNSINIGILATLIVRLVRPGAAGWVDAVQSLFSRATVAYVVWTAFLLLAIPLIFNY